MVPPWGGDETNAPPMSNDLWSSHPPTISIPYLRMTPVSQILWPILGMIHRKHFLAKPFFGDEFYLFPNFHHRWRRSIPRHVCNTTEQPFSMHALCRLYFLNFRPRASFIWSCTTPHLSCTWLNAHHSNCEKTSSPFHQFRSHGDITLPANYHSLPMSLSL